MCYFSAKFGYFFIWLAGKICVWWVADFLAIFETCRRKIWRIFVQVLDQCLIQKNLEKSTYCILPPNLLFLVVTTH